MVKDVKVKDNVATPKKGEKNEKDIVANMMDKGIEEIISTTKQFGDRVDHIDHKLEEFSFEFGVLKNDVEKIKTTNIKYRSPERSFAESLSKFQSNMPTIEKNKEVGFDTKKGGAVKFKYADLAQIWEKIKKPLTDNGFSVLQPINHEDDGIYLYTKLIHKDGHSLSTKIKLFFDGKDIKNMGMAISYNRRYCLCSMLGIVSDDDVDDLGDIEFNNPEPSDEEKFITAKKKFLIKYGMDKQRTEYHDYIEDVVSGIPMSTFEDILSQAVVNEKGFVNKFNEWKKEKNEN